MVRNKPQKADIIELLLSTKIKGPRRAFIGYPPYLGDKSKEITDNFHGAVCDLTCSDEKWGVYHKQADTPYKRQLSTNRNLVKDAVEDSIILIPRPDRGLVYCGTISHFELVNSPTWGQSYLDLRLSQGLKEPKDQAKKASHLRDVIQSFVIKESKWCEVTFPSIPAWIRKSFFGRSSTARIHPLWDIDKKKIRQGFDPVVTMKALMRGERPDSNWQHSSDIKEIEHRLLTKIGPETFEHLMVALLDLEEDLVWEQVGGSGDGGVDGIGSSFGVVKAILQSKWSYNGEAIRVADLQKNNNCRVILSALLHAADVKYPDHVEFYGLNRVAKLIIKHADALPWAKLMRVKQDKEIFSKT